MAAGSRIAGASQQGESHVRTIAGHRASMGLTGALTLVGCLAVPLLVPGHAGATPADMATLPTVAPFECLICHVHANPTPPTRELNVFGLDFLANGRIWDGALANGDSDGDGCLNGVELGDAAGDGFPDGNVTVLETNPGDGTDCGNLIIDARTWGALKAMFDRR